MTTMITRYLSFNHLV